MENIKDLLLKDLEERLELLGEDKYRAMQIMHWIYREGATSFDQMSDLSLALREKLKTIFSVTALESQNKQISVDGTAKYLFRLNGEALIETVMIPTPKRRTVCVSSQVGCLFGCRFCASGLGGFGRNLSASQIIDQVVFVEKDIGSRVTNVTMMGIGEPLANYDNVVKAIRIMNCKDCLGLGARKITISTCGFVPSIRRLAKENLQIELSVSLHAPDNPTRDKIMPVNRKYNIEDLLQTCRDFIRQTKRQVTFEYLLLKSVNDSPRCAEKLGALIKGINCKVNVIPYNPVSGLRFEAPATDTINLFLQKLKDCGVKFTPRETRGRDIDAACGQLRWSRGQPHRGT
jgi:23S rRNA (adenine2503-C2)-methyltransferase